MGILLNVIYIVLLFLIGFALLSVCMNTLFVKVRINKWIPLIASIGLLLFQMFGQIPNIIVNGIITIACVILFMWFWQIHQTGGPQAKEKPIVIKPKAKPNRVKHMQKNNDDK